MTTFKFKYTLNLYFLEDKESRMLYVYEFYPNCRRSTWQYHKSFYFKTRSTRSILMEAAIATVLFCRNSSKGGALQKHKVLIMMTCLFGASAAAGSVSYPEASQSLTWQPAGIPLPLNEWIFCLVLPFSCCGQLRCFSYLSVLQQI